MTSSPHLRITSNHSSAMAPNSPRCSFIHASMAGSRSTAPLNRSNRALIVARFSLSNLCCVVPPIRGTSDRSCKCVRFALCANDSTHAFGIASILTSRKVGFSVTSVLNFPVTPFCGHYKDNDYFRIADSPPETQNRFRMRLNGDLPVIANQQASRLKLENSRSREGWSSGFADGRRDLRPMTGALHSAMMSIKG